MPTADQITQAANSIIAAAELDSGGAAMTDQVRETLRHAIQTADAFPTSWANLWQMVWNIRGEEHEVMLVLPAIEYCKLTKRFFPAMPQ